MATKSEQSAAVDDDAADAVEDDGPAPFSDDEFRQVALDEANRWRTLLERLAQ